MEDVDGLDGGMGVVGGCGVCGGEKAAEMDFLGLAPTSSASFHFGL